MCRFTEYSQFASLLPSLAAAGMLPGCFRDAGRDADRDAGRDADRDAGRTQLSMISKPLEINIFGSMARLPSHASQTI